MNTNATEFHPKSHLSMNKDAPAFTPKSKAKPKGRSNEAEIHIENTGAEFTPKKFRLQTPPSTEAPSTPSTPGTSSAASTPTKAHAEESTPKEEHPVPQTAKPNTSAQASAERKETALSPKPQNNTEHEPSTPSKATKEKEAHSSKHAKENTAAKKGQSKQQRQEPSSPSKKEKTTTTTTTTITTATTITTTSPATSPVTPVPSTTPTISVPLSSVSPPLSATTVLSDAPPKMSFAERLKLTHENKQKEMMELAEQERIKKQQEQERAEQEKAKKKRSETPPQGGSRGRHGDRSRGVSTSPVPRTATPTQTVKAEASSPLRAASPGAAVWGKGGRREDGETHLLKPKPVSRNAEPAKGNSGNSGSSSNSSPNSSPAAVLPTPPPVSRSAKYPSEQLCGTTPPPAVQTPAPLEPYERRGVVSYATMVKYQKMFTEAPADFDDFCFLLKQLEQSYVAPQSDSAGVLTAAELCMRTVIMRLNQMTDKNVAATAAELSLLEIDRAYPPSNATLVGEFCTCLVGKAISEPKVFTPSYAELVRLLTAYPRFRGIRKEILVILQAKMKSPPAEVRVPAEEELRGLKYCQRERMDAETQSAQNAVRDYRGCCRFIGHLVKAKVFTPLVCGAVLADCFSLDPLPTSVVLSGMEEFLGIVLSAWVEDPQGALGELVEKTFARIAGVYRQFPKMYYFRFDDLLKKFDRHRCRAGAAPTPGLDEAVHAAATPGLPGASDVEEVRAALRTADGLVALVEESGLAEQRKVLRGALLCAVEADDGARTADSVVAQLRKLLPPETISAEQVVEALLFVCAEAPYLAAPLATTAGRVGRCLALAVRAGVVSYTQLVRGVFAPLSKRAFDEARACAGQHDAEEEAAACQIRTYGLAGAYLGSMLAALAATPEDAARVAQEIAECDTDFFSVFGEETRTSFAQQCAFIRQHRLVHLFPEYAAKERVYSCLKEDVIDEAKLKSELSRCAAKNDSDEDEDNTAWYIACFNAFLGHIAKGFFFFLSFFFLSFFLLSLFLLDFHFIFYCNLLFIIFIVVFIL